MAANIFTGTTNSNWGTATNWSLGSVPTASDGHVATFDASSPDCTVNASSRVCNAIDFTGYTNTISGDAARTLTVSGNITLGAGMGDGGNIKLIQGLTNITITSNGYYWKGAFEDSGKNFTLADNMEVYDLIILATDVTISGTQKIIVHNSWYQQAVLNANGTTIEFNGTDVSSTHVHPEIYTISACNLILNISGTWTVNLAGAGKIMFIGGSFTQTSGTIFENYSSNYGFHFRNNTTVNISQKLTTVAIGSVTINTELKATTLYLDPVATSGTFVIAGSKGFNVDNLYYIFPSYIETFKLTSTKNYYVSSYFEYNGLTNVLVSTTATSAANLILGASCVAYVFHGKFTDIDCSGGKALGVFKGILTRTTNITSYNDLNYLSVLPAITDVKTGVTYSDARGTVFTGTLASGGGAIAIMT